MDKSRALFLKLDGGETQLTSAEAKLVMGMLQNVKLNEKGEIRIKRNFAKLRNDAFKVGLPTDRCFSCGRPY